MPSTAESLLIVNIAPHGTLFYANDELHPLDDSRKVLEQKYLALYILDTSEFGRDRTRQACLAKENLIKKN